MFGFGAGPVRGFAWTLVIGVFTSVFTSVLITQVLLGLVVQGGQAQKLPIA
jgi:preprotein translocase subunit SecD